jgi:hypothetical protein
MPSLQSLVDQFQIGVVEVAIGVTLLREDRRERHNAALRDTLGCADLINALHRARDE